MYEYHLWNPVPEWYTKRLRYSRAPEYSRVPTGTRWGPASFLPPGLSAQNLVLLRGVVPLLPRPTHRSCSVGEPAEGSLSKRTVWAPRGAPPGLVRGGPPRGAPNLPDPVSSVPRPRWPRAPGPRSTTQVSEPPGAVPAPLRPIKLSTTDLLVLASMKNAAKCDK